jgi:hypothetical protein
MMEYIRYGPRTTNSCFDESTCDLIPMAKLKSCLDKMEDELGLEDRSR